TLLIHGDKDTDVPYEQSQLMTAELKKNGVEHQFITVAGAEHGLAGGKPDEIQAVNKAAVEFLRKYLGAEEVHTLNCATENAGRGLLWLRSLAIVWRATKTSRRQL